MIRQRGFTLIELLVAIGVFAFVSAMAFGGLQATLSARDRTEAASRDLVALQKAFTIMQQDFEQIAPRSIRDRFGNLHAAVPLQSEQGGVSFTRGGRLNPLGLERSGLERAGYFLTEDGLVRRRWLTLDQPIDPKEEDSVLLEATSELSFRFLGANERWVEDWPPPGAPHDLLPRAVEVTVESETMGPIPRIFLLPY